jgi:hypothetical protein
MSPIPDKSSEAERFFLRIFKAVVLVVMGLALLATIAALVGALYFYLQSPKPPTPAQDVPRKSVDIDEFIKQLEPKDEKKDEQKEEKKEDRNDPKPPAEKERKYIEDTRKIIACVKQSNEKAGLDAQGFSEDVIDSFRRDIARVADETGRDRGQPYVSDAVRVVCAIMLHDKVIALRQKNHELRVFIPAVNFHIRQWDQIQLQARQFEEREAKRMAQEERDEEARVMHAREQGKLALMGALAGFALFMAIALYLIFAAIESHLRRIGHALEGVRSDCAALPRASAGDTP